MASVNFRHIAAGCRQAYNGVRRPTQVLEGMFNLSSSEIPRLIQFFYEDGRIEQRLTDEDLREIFLLLTDVYPEEVDTEPDLVQVMSNLSEEKETKATFAFVYQQMERMFATGENKVRSMIMRALLKRITTKDIYWLLLRLTRRANPFRRRDALRALADHHGLLYGRLLRESMFTKLPMLAQRIEEGQEFLGVPSIGDKFLLPLPRRFDTASSLPFPSNNHLEVIRGERLVFHCGDGFMSIVNPNGEDQAHLWDGPYDSGPDLLEVLPHGIYIIENVPQDDCPLTVVDVLLAQPLIHEQSWEERRAWLEDNCPDMFIKPIEQIDSHAQLKANTPKNGICFIHNGSGHLSYTSSRDEVVRFSMKATGDIFRLVGGVWQHDDTRGLVMNGWRVAARDGIDGYYEVGTIPCEPELEHHLTSLTDGGKAVEGEVVLMEGPTFVEVTIHFANYDERGIVIQGVITGVIPTAGVSDVVAVEEVEWLVGEDD